MIEKMVENGPFTIYTIADWHEKDRQDAAEHLGYILREQEKMGLRLIGTATHRDRLMLILQSV
jgi:hypothetical protein